MPNYDQHRQPLLRLSRIVLGTLFLVTTCSSGFGQDADGSVNDWYRYYLHRAETDYRLTCTSEDQEMALVRTPILNWTNPLEAGQINGSSFVWELNGRPLAIGQFFSYLAGKNQRSYCHVFTTLTDEPIEGRYKDKLFWRPKLPEKSGWRTDMKAAPVGETPVVRLRQMRNIARQFSAHTDENSRGRRNLRLLPQPLYRYDQDTRDLEGALFAYVVGNDPELMLLVECDLTSDAPSWRYRFAQSTRSTTIAVRKGEEVYRFDTPKGNPANAESPYLSRHGVQSIADDPKFGADKSQDVE